MKIGLVRHFQVKQDYPQKRLVSQQEVMEWFAAYDSADIEPGEANLGGIEWSRCYASDMPRAMKTAEAIYREKFIPLQELREIPIYPIFQRNWRLPFLLWAFVFRMAWLLNHPSQKERRTDVEARAAAVLDRILASGEENVLIVGHGAFMMFMRKELLKRGFRGPALHRPVHGQLYVYER